MNVTNAAQAAEWIAAWVWASNPEANAPRFRRRARESRGLAVSCRHVRQDAAAEGHDAAASLCEAAALEAERLDALDTERRDQERARVLAADAERIAVLRRARGFTP